MDKKKEKSGKKSKIEKGYGLNFNTPDPVVDNDDKEESKEEVENE